ncbi:hypothetical protein [Caballeronia humi]|uniref:Uncharacterized protein n=1 Tax=Caballeronia humi TaxID=326474 RepID=A0A158IWT0_9BURK|nr:hypothetical protein [Caballeronia humi]SAL61094.1 hypothetical protein AWB65_05549 [Caballeronia humi]
MNAKLIATAAAAGFLVAQAALAQMPEQAQQLVQTMRPMQAAPGSGMSQEAPTQAASTNETSYGGATDTRSMSASARRQGACGAAQNCDIFFGQ